MSEVAPSTVALATWVAELSSARLPETVRQKTRDAVLDTVGVAMAGSQQTESKRLAAALVPRNEREGVTVIGGPRRASAPTAALLNAYAAHVLDFDDTHVEAIVHLNAPVFGACLALAELEGTHGAAFLCAFAAGVEVTARVAIAASSQHERGWHLTGLAGTIGAAAGAGRILGLGAAQMTYCLGIASTLASGLRAHRGTGTKALNPAHAAYAGILAAVSARGGLTSSTTALEDSELGLFATLGVTELSALTSDLGREFRMLGSFAKPYPCGVVTHPAVDAILDLAAGLPAQLAPSQVEQINLRVHPLALRITGNPTPMNGLEAKFSVYHAVASALLSGQLLPKHFDDEFVLSGEVVAMRNRISVTADDSLTRHEAEVTLVRRTGEPLTHCAIARGTLDRPMTPSDIESKFRRLTIPLIGEATTDVLIDIVRGLERLPSVAPIVNRMARTDEPIPGA